MNNKELIDFANWLWDMDYLNINSQLPPFKNAETLANHYCTVKKLNMPCVSVSLLYKKLTKWYEERHLIECDTDYMNAPYSTLGDRFEEIRDFLNELGLDCNDR